MKFPTVAKIVLATAAALCVAPSATAQTRAGADDQEPKRATTTRQAPVRAVQRNDAQQRSDAVRSSETQAVLATNVKGIAIDPDAISSHQMRPANVVGVISDDGQDERESDGPVRALVEKSRRTLSSSTATSVRAEIAKMSPENKPAATISSRIARVVPVTPGAIGELAAPPKPKLGVNAFGEAFHAAIKDSVAGYALRIGQNGQTIYTLQWNWAQTQSDAGLGWNPSRRMHVASVSKLITAIAMADLLVEKNISYDAKIINYLPSYWQKGPNIDDITFRQLLSHRSGFDTDSSSSDYQFMKSRVASGFSSSKNGTYDYENMNFGLCRILIAVINGNINKNTVFPSFINDLLWDAVTINAYEQYVNQKVFAPAGVNGPSLDKPNSPARAYPWPVAGSGWNSGDLRSMAGGAAWHMSINELLAVMHTFRRTNKIMPMSKAQEALDANFGIDRITNTSAGKLYDKNGRWRDGNQRTEQSVAVFMPDGMDIVVLTNSPIGPNAASLRNLVRDLYIANIVDP